MPDAGARLEDLLIRLRRPHGMSMSQWANKVQEAYRRVQRAVIRARQLQRAKDKADSKSEPEPQREPSENPPSPKSPSRTSQQSPSRSTVTSPRRRPAGYGADPLSGIQESGDENGDYAAVPREEPEAPDADQNGGRLRIGESGEKSRGGDGRRMTLRVAKTFHGMSFRLRRCRSCWTKFLDGCC